MQELTQSNEVCGDQKKRTLFVEQESRRMGDRLAGQKVAQVFNVVVYAFNCADKRHTEPHPFHLDYVAGGGRFDIPGSIESTIKALEHCISELKKKAQ